MPGTFGSQSGVGKGTFSFNHLWIFSLQTHIFFHALLGPGKYLTPTSPRGDELHHCIVVCNKPLAPCHAPHPPSMGTHQELSSPGEL